VSVLPNPGYVTMASRIQGFLQDAEEDDVVLLYYSGHGVLGWGNEASLRFARESMRRTAVTARACRRGEISTWLEACPAANRIVLLDCCYASAFGRISAEQISTGEGPLRPGQQPRTLPRRPAAAG
jgi:hypothetical protein